MATLCVSTLLKPRDAHLAMAPKFVLRKERFDLKNSKFMGFDLLFPQEQVSGTNKHQKKPAQSVVIDQAFKLRVSAVKLSEHSILPPSLLLALLHNRVSQGGGSCAKKHPATILSAH